MPDTNAELAKKLWWAAESATTGPWSTESGGYDDDWPIKGSSDYLCASPDDGVRGGHTAADAILIVLLRNNLPQIIAALEATEGKAEAWDEGWNRAEAMAKSWGHTDSWGEENPYPTNPYRSAS